MVKILRFISPNNESWFRFFGENLSSEEYRDSYNARIEGKKTYEGIQNIPT